MADVRETPVRGLIDGLVAKGAIVNWHDELVKVWEGSHSVEISSDYDLAIIATAHEHVDLSKLHGVPIINSRDSV